MKPTPEDQAAIENWNRACSAFFARNEIPDPNKMIEGEPAQKLPRLLQLKERTPR